jgi:hypothetical protein
LAKVRLKPGENTLTYTVKAKPAEAAIDPYNEIIDRNLDDNRKDIKL